MNIQRGRAISVSSALANLPRPNSIRRSLSSQSFPRSIRVVVLGAGGVGKTAMAVRFVTKRFIGDYDPNLETIYRHTAVVDDEVVNFEIMDTAGQQDEESLALEDKCRWGEAFIFVYDVTDKYSFVELDRLKFVASYAHSKSRLSFTPCWGLVGNKSDLADHERIISIEEGRERARDLRCHIFREISVKESMYEAGEVFEDLWREFSKRSPRSPSSSQRRKFSYRIQDKIPVLNSNSCACDTWRHSPHNVVTSLANTLRRQSLASGLIKYSKDFYSRDDDRIDEVTRNIPRIPEVETEESEVSDEPRRRRRNAVVGGFNPPATPRRTPLSKALSVDNVFSKAMHERDDVSSSSTTSSITSLNGSISPSNKQIFESFEGTRSDSDSSPQSRDNNASIVTSYPQSYFPAITSTY
nr:ras-like protein family member 11A [Ciona intestinalis]|eukprot:XP_002126977.1 ras-like protein family member 11A [Ciona intestinalis]